MITKSFVPAKARKDYLFCWILSLRELGWNDIHACLTWNYSNGVLRITETIDDLHTSGTEHSGSIYTLEKKTIDETGAYDRTARA